MAKKAFGTKLQYESAVSPSVWTDIAAVTNIKPFDKKVDVIDGSSHDSTNEFREKLAGMKDSGDVQLDINYDPANTSHQAMESQLGAAENFKLLFAGAPTGRTSGTFSGFVKGFTPGAPHDGKFTATVVIEITGEITWA